MNFKKRVNGSWDDTPHYIHNTSTDTITTLPAVLYPTGTTATVGLKGNTVQSGTPTPDNPIMPEGCGDLETTGEHTGQYKIPISSANTTTPVYLGELETTRKIKKLVLTGEETSWTKASSAKVYYLWQYDDDAVNSANIISCMCSHYSAQGNVATVSGVENLKCCFRTTAQTLYIHDDAFESNADFVTYLQQQYAAGTPVTVWYVLATETTGIVNEPLRKIGTYADEVSGISIPTIAGANTLSVDTTLQPSEVSVNYKGWHPVQSVHEADDGAWT